MKKAKKLLAVLLAAVMLASAACLPVYAKLAGNPGNYSIPTSYTNTQNYYFSAEKGCSYILDMIDEMLGEAYLRMEWDDLLDGGNTIIDIANALIGDNIPEVLDFTSVDKAVDTLYDFINAVDDGVGGAIADIDALAGDITKEGNLQLGSLNKNIERGTRSKNYADGHSDLRVLYNLLGWLNSNTWLLQQIIAGTLPMGALGDMIYDLATIDGIALLPDLDTGVTNLLYKLLIDSTASGMPAGMTLEDAVQKMLNWALVEGTGESAENGGFSMLGMNHEPLMPVLADTTKYPGGVSITAVEIPVDRDGDGVNDKMDVYQLVNNLINGLLNGILAPELGGIIADLVGVEITEQYPNGDPAILKDVLFSTILGAVEGLLVNNGADPVVYTEAEGQETPMGKINDLVTWLFNGSNGGKPALYTFINIDYYGIGLTDNFMSLLNDLIRLAINLLPVLGIELPPNSGLPTSDELAETYWYKLDESGNKVICDETDEGAVDQLFMTYYGEKVCFANYTDDTKKVVDYYTYFDDGVTPVNTADSTAGDYENPKFIRPYYKIAMDSVWAALVKMLLSMFIEGPYFPEWTTDMSSVLAYGCAGLAVSILPEEDYYKRLDAYYYNGYSTSDYYYSGESVATKPIAYSNKTARSVAALPTGAMDILSAVAAYWLNTLCDVTGAERFETHDTSFEQLLTELALWGFVKYVPILAGEPDAAGDTIHESAWTDDNGNVHPAGTYAPHTNDLIEAVYSDFSTRTELANPNYDAVYTYIDNTVLSLIPASWLPDEFGSSQHLFNDWLFGNLMEFDLQGILSLFSANPEGELGESLLVVLLRVIDRVLAVILGGNALLQPTDRSGVGSNSVYAVNTTITTLTALIEDGDGGEGNTDTPATASLPVLFGKLLQLLYTYRVPLLETFLPFLVSQSFERPYNNNIMGDDNYVNSLGSNMATYKIADLVEHIDYLTKNINAEFYASYTTEEDAEAAVENLENAYIDAVEVTPATETTEAVYKYDVYISLSYLDSATKTEVVNETEGNYNTFSNWTYKSINPASSTQPMATWDNANYYFWSVEDTNPNGYYYGNFNSAVDEAKEFVDTYNGVVESQLSGAFGDWLIYNIEARLVNLNLYDPNDDGKCVTSTSDEEYKDVTTDAEGNVTDPGFPVDGYPSVPNSIYPYLCASSDTTAVTFLDAATDSNISVTRNSLTEANYELMTMAREYGEDPANYVELSLWDTENVVRLALETMEFDITANADGTYDGAYQWSSLQDAQLSSVANFCSANYMHFEYDVANNVYKIYRKGFSFITDSFYLGTVDGTNTLSAKPVSSRAYVYDPSDHVAAEQAIYDGYTDFVELMYSTRRSLYNQIAQLDWRMHDAETHRKTNVDLTMLNWALNHVKHAYKSENDKRNLVASGIVDGVTQYTKVYTQKTYNPFRDAYDFAESLSKIQVGQTAGVTQSMVTEAFHGLLDAYNALVKFTSAADWVKFLAVLAQAEELASPDGIRYTEYGLTDESGAELDAIIEEAYAFYANKDIMDGENQPEIESMAGKIETVILNLKYKKTARLEANEETGGDTKVITTSEGSRVIGQIVGLVEGKGIDTLDLIQERGMVINESVGNQVTIQESGKGFGTGAYYKGETSLDGEVFRYYAVLYGDLNGDARIDGTDWSMIYYKILTKNNETAGAMGGEYIYEAADIDRNGKVTEEDATAIRNHYNYVTAIDQIEHSSEKTAA